MLEWLKRHAWKACIRQKRIPGSNHGLSAKNGLMLPVSPRNANDVRIFLCKNPLTFNELADFFVSKTANFSQFYVETKRSRFCVSVRIFLFAFLLLLMIICLFLN